MHFINLHNGWCRTWHFCACIVTNFFFFLRNTQRYDSGTSTLKMDLHLKLDSDKNAQLSAEPERGHLESNSAVFGWYSDKELLEGVQPHGIIAAGRDLWRSPVQVPAGSRADFPVPSAYWGPWASSVQILPRREIQEPLRPLSSVLPPSQWTFVSNHFIQISLASTLNGASCLVPSFLLKTTIP